MRAIITARGPLKGELVVPGDKSISHRALILGALSEGLTQIRGLSKGEDVESTVRCLQALGVTVESMAEEVLVHGSGRAGLRAAAGPLDARNSGTTLRLLAGVVAGQRFTTTITGDESLRRRPMKRIIEPLRRMGAQIEAQPGDVAPLKITGASLKSITYPLPVASAQVKSCVLLAGLLASGETVVVEPIPTRDHTERLLAAFGVRVHRDGRRISIRGGQALRSQAVQVPGDLSSAAFFLAAASVVPGSELLIRDVGLNPTRSGFLTVLHEMGGSVEILSQKLINNEPVGNLRVRSASLRGVQVGGGLIPAIIDEIPVLAVLATQAQGRTEIRDAAELRLKESDRIASVAEGLRRMGATVEELPDGMVIEGPTRLRAAEVDSHSDHRVAMAFSVAGLMCQGQTVIGNAEAVSVSFPEFFGLLEGVQNG